VTIALAILSRIWPYLLGAGVLLGLYTWDNNRCNAACVKQTKRADALQAESDAAHKRATALAILWAAQVDKTEKEAHDAEALRREAFDKLESRIRALPSIRGIRLSPATWRVLSDASDLANARTPQEHHDTPEAISESDLARKWAEAAAAYADAYAHWSSCVRFYEGLRNEQTQ